MAERGPRARASDRPADDPLTIEEYARALRDRVPDVAALVAERIEAEVPAYAGSPGGRRRELMAHGIEQATHRFLDALDGQPHRDRGVDELVHGMAKSEAIGPGDVTAFNAALRLAAAVTWEHLRGARFGRPVDDEVRGRLADTLFTHLVRVVEQAEAGFAAGRRAIASDLGLARGRLAEQLLTGGRPSAADVSPSVWRPPSSVVVAVSEPDPDHLIDVGALLESHLVVRHEHRVIVIADAASAETMTSDLVDYGVRIAVTWPVDPSVVPSAHRWGRRALELVERGVVPDEPVIDCQTHRTQIWLHAEPALRQCMSQDLLRPLFTETTNAREILSETLLIWLETRASAPAIAAQLGVHAQTVRYRWKRINELFGDDLHDPEFIISMTMLLKASVPLWRAGDLSDFDRFREESA